MKADFTKYVIEYRYEDRTWDYGNVGFYHCSPVEWNLRDDFKDDSTSFTIQINSNGILRVVT